MVMLDVDSNGLIIHALFDVQDVRALKQSSPDNLLQPVPPSGLFKGLTSLVLNANVEMGCSLTNYIWLETFSDSVNAYPEQTEVLCVSARPIGDFAHSVLLSSCGGLQGFCQKLFT